MSKYEVGDKFIIEIAQKYHVRPTEDRNKDEDIIPDATLYRIKGFKAAVWDASGLDRLEKCAALPEPMKLYRPYWMLLEEPSDMTEKERERLKRIKTIPDSVRVTVEEKINNLRSKVMGLEADIDSMIEFLNGEEQKGKKNG